MAENSDDGAVGFLVDDSRGGVGAAALIPARSGLEVVFLLVGVCVVRGVEEGTCGAGGACVVHSQWRQTARLYIVSVLSRRKVKRLTNKYMSRVCRPPNTVFAMSRSNVRGNYVRIAACTTLQECCLEQSHSR